jgi:coproporphyrinogen III oxidase
MLVKDGNRLSYTTSDGEILKFYRKEWERNEGGCLDVVMGDFGKVAEKSQTEITNIVEPQPESVE